MCDLMGNNGTVEWPVERNLECGAMFLEGRISENNNFLFCLHVCAQGRFHHRVGHFRYDFNCDIRRHTQSLGSQESHGITSSATGIGCIPIGESLNGDVLYCALNLLSIYGCRMQKRGCSETGSNARSVRKHTNQSDRNARPSVAAGCCNPFTGIDEPASAHGTIAHRRAGRLSI